MRLAPQWSWLFLSFVLLLNACGGGGGGGGGGSDGGNFTLSTTSVALQGKRYGALPPAARVQMRLKGGSTTYVGAAYRYGPAPEWLGVSIDGASPNFEVVLSISSTSLAPGHYSAVLSVGTADDEGNILEARDIQVAYNVVTGIVIAGSPVSTSTVAGTGQPIPGQSVQVRGSGLSYQATTSASWLSVSAATRVADDWLPLTFDATGLTPGIYQATVTARNVADATDVASLGVTLEVTSPQMTLPPNATPVAAEITFGSSIRTARSTVVIAGDPTTFAVSTSSSWLTVPAGTQMGPGQFDVDFDATGLNIGTHTGSVRLTNQADPSKTLDVPVTLTVRTPQITVSGLGTFGGQNGRDTAAKSVSISLDTGTNAYPWTSSMTSDNDWLRVTGATSGSVSQTATATTVLDADRGNLGGGTYQGLFTVTAQVGDQTVTSSIPVTLVMAENRLEVSELGVAFSDFPSRKTLSRALTVHSTYGLTDVPWSAVSDQSWLTVTPSGTTGGALQLQADPSGLAPGMTHIATVTVTSPRAAVQNTQVVRVGLWVGLADPQTVETTEYLPIGPFSPVEPVAYGVTGSGSIKAYNLYSGALVREYTGLGDSLSSIYLSADGRVAYVDDQTVSVVKAVDLISGMVLQTFPYIKPTSSYGASILKLRLRGREFLFVKGYGPASVYDVPSGEKVTEVTDLPSFYVQSHDFLDLYGFETSQLLRRTRAEFSEVDNVFSFAPTQDTFASDYRMDAVAVSRDGAGIYVDDVPQLRILDRNLQPTATLVDLPCCTEKLLTMTNGLWISAGDDDDYDQDPEIHFFTADGELIESFFSGAGRTRLIGVSGDATRVVSESLLSGTRRTLFRNTPAVP